MKRFLMRRWLFIAAFTVSTLVAAPAAWAVGWTNVGSANVHLNDINPHAVSTGVGVYSSQMRLYVQTHSPCGGANFLMDYLNPSDLSIYAESTLREICTAAETPSNWGVAGGNKVASCSEGSLEPTDPASTCQRYSTT